MSLMEFRIKAEILNLNLAKLQHSGNLSIRVTRGSVVLSDLSNCPYQLLLRI